MPEYVNILQEQSQYGMKDPQMEMVFSTVHKFKGLEMVTVRMLDDLPGDSLWQASTGEDRCG